MDKLYYQKEKKIPTLLAFLILSLIVTGLNFVFTQQKNFSIRAVKKQLARLEITNLTHNTATIFWQTPEKLVSFLVYGEEKNRLNKQIFDDRDVLDKKEPRLNHYVILKNLVPNKKYFFEIVTSKYVIKQKDDTPFDFFTKARLPQPVNLRPATGNIQNKNGTPLHDGIVLLKIEGSNLLSDRTKEKGEWLIPLYYLTKINSNEFLQPTENTLVTIEIISEEGETSTVKTTVKKVTPLPKTIIIGKNYDFINEEEKVLSQTTENQPKPAKIDIISPKEGAAIDGRKPMLRGIALPGKKVKIIIESKIPQKFEIYTDKDGIWRLTPFYDLDPGEHRIVLITEDDQGKEIKITRTFAILKSGEGVLGEATPSATLIPTIPTPTFPPSTTYPTQMPTTTLSPTKIISPTEPTPGINFFPLTIFGGALILLGTGLVIIF